MIQAKMLRAIVFLAFFALVKCQTVGNCSAISGNAVNFTELDGVWFEVSRVPNNFESGNCSTVTFNQTAGTLVVTEVVDGAENVFQGNYTQSTNNSTFVLTVNGTSFDMTVLSTNYNGYALIYNCLQLSNTASQVWGWTLLRNATLTAANQQLIDAVLAANPEVANLPIYESVHSEEACKVNSGSSLRVSAAILTVMLGVFKIFK